MNQTSLENLADRYHLGKVGFYPSLSSTNTLALSWASDGCPDLSLIVADQQTGGKGRSGRRWHTIAGTSIAASLILTKFDQPFNPPEMIGISALATADTLAEFTDHPVTIKWPNDILIDGKKGAGILVESQWEEDQITSIVLGIGINIHPESLVFPDPPRVPATYLLAHTSGTPSRTEVLEALIRRILHWRSKKHPAELFSEWNKRLAYRGLEIEATKNDSDRLTGHLLGVSEHGSLEVRLPDNTTVLYDANEIREINSPPRSTKNGE